MDRRRSLSTILAALTACWVAFFLAGCGALPALPAGYERHQQTVEGLTVTLDTLRGPVVNQAQPFRITLTDEQGRPVDGAQIYLDLDMNMICLSGARPMAAPDGPGQYTASSLYQMPGDWEVTVVARLEGRERRATFVIPVADAPDPR